MKLAMLGLMSAAILFPTASAHAQVTVPPVTTASPGYLFPNDRYQREREENRSSAPRERRTTTSQANPCSPEALPASERRAMEVRFLEIDRTQGRAAANAWVNEQGRLFAQRLVAEGVCTADGRPVR